MSVQKAQLSFEFMVYLSLAGLSLLSSLSLLNHFSGSIQSSLYRYELSDLVSKVNLASLTGITSQLVLPIPQALCNATVIGDRLVTKYGNFSLAGELNLKNGSFCNGKLQSLMNGMVT